MALKDGAEKPYQLQSDIVADKPTDTSGGTVTYDLTSPASSVSYSLSNSFVNVVTRSTEMRLDRICNNLYGRTDYVHHLMKANQIMNPFAIKSGDVIAWADINDMDAMVVSTQEGEDQRKQLVDEFKRSQVDSTRVTFLRSKAATAATSAERTRLEAEARQAEAAGGKLPPTVAPAGFSQIGFSGQDVVVTPSLAASGSTNQAIADVTKSDARGAKIRALERSVAAAAAARGAAATGNQESVPFSINAAGLNPARNRNGLSDPAASPAKDAAKSDASAASAAAAAAAADKTITMGGAFRALAARRRAGR